ncbi:hypothetical protein ACFQS7_17425 [Dankookia sp. GCM10030260]|uniref:hypothetical protein n=1 Tax=Dankookia sp. GCM10030260 TaxID=3273390 RepID=UPI00360DE28F
METAMKLELVEARVVGVPQTVSIRGEGRLSASLGIDDRCPSSQSCGTSENRLPSWPAIGEFSCPVNIMPNGPALLNDEALRSIQWRFGGRRVVVSVASQPE